MFFGRPEPETVRLEELEALLVSQFEKKLGNFASRAGAIFEELKASRHEFMGACAELEGVEAEPYTEDLYQPNLEFIKSQKAIYSRTLRKIMGSAIHEPEQGKPSYERYKEALAINEHAANEIMKANATYKVVMYSYARHITSFKRSFSSMERNMVSLRKEIRSREREGLEYESLKNGIGMLRDSVQDLEMLRNGIALLKSPSGEDEGEAIIASETEILNAAEAKRSELSGIEKEMASASARISLATAPLDRVSKKFDHLSMRKKSLHELLTDPVKALRDEVSYGELIGTVKELRASVEGGAIETKNRDGTIAAIDSLLASDIYGSAASVRMLSERRASILREIKDMERIVADFHTRREEKTRRLAEHAEMLSRKNQADKRVAKEKKEVEMGFAEHYHKSISVQF